MKKEREESLVTVSERPYNAETPFSALLPPLTPNHLFYVRNHFEVPTIELPNWVLNVGGAVHASRSFDLEEIRSFPNTSQVVLLECAGNGRTSLEPPVNGTQWGLGAVAQAEFTGIPLYHLLERVNPKEEAVEVVFVGADSGKVRTGETASYARSLPLELARDPDVMLVWDMNSQPLTPDHGFPLRLVVPGWYGMASVKWLQEIRLVTSPFDGFFQKDDYVYSENETLPEGDPVGGLRVRSLIVSHSDGESLSLGRHAVSGIAWGGEGGIAEISISLDSGVTWVPATLESSTEKYAWIRWKASLVFGQSGTHIVMVRAADGEGNRQPLEPFWNKGGYGNNVVHQISVRVG